MTEAPTPSQIINLAQGSVTIQDHEYPLREWDNREWTRYLRLNERFDKVRIQTELGNLAKEQPQKLPKARAAEQRLKKDRKRFDAALERMEREPENWEDEDDEKFEKLTECLEASIERNELLETEFLVGLNNWNDRVTELNDQLEQATDECYVRMAFYLAWYGTDDVVLDSDEYKRAEQAWVDNLTAQDVYTAERICRVGQRDFLARVAQRLQLRTSQTPGTSGASTSGRSRTGSRQRATPA